MHHSPLKMLNSFLIKGESPSLLSCLFYEPRLRYIANQSGSAKETVSLKISKNIEMLVVLFVWGQRLWHMKNKGMRQSQVLQQNSEVVDM